MASNSTMDVKIPFQQSVGTTYNNAQWPTLVAAGVVAFTSILLVALRFWSSTGTPKVKILLQDEIKSARQRALEYCFNPRAVMAKGYAKVWQRLLRIRLNADGLVQK
jgi:hypothetical protein